MADASNTQTTKDIVLKQSHPMRNAAGRRPWQIVRRSDVYCIADADGKVVARCIAFRNAERIVEAVNVRI